MSVFYRCLMGVSKALQAFLWFGYKLSWTQCLGLLVGWFQQKCQNKQIGVPRTDCGFYLHVETGEIPHEEVLTWEKSLVSSWGIKEDSSLTWTPHSIKSTLTNVGFDMILSFRDFISAKQHWNKVNNYIVQYNLWGDSVRLLPHPFLTSPRWPSCKWSNWDLLAHVGAPAQYSLNPISYGGGPPRPPP